MRLSKIVPLITLESVRALEKCGIRTESDLLFTPASEIYKRLPQGSISLQELMKLRTAVAEYASPTPILGNELLRREEQTRHEIPAEMYVGDKGIDQCLEGLGGTRVIEVSGDKASGKSTLVLNIVLDHLVKYPNDTAAWIDVAGDFSPARVSTILESRQIVNPTLVLQRLLVSLAFDTEALHSILDELYPSHTGNVPRYLVIDTITPLLGPMLSGITAHGHAVMTDLMKRLRTISQTHGVTVLVVNTSTLAHSADGTTPIQDIERKPALGPSFTFMSDTTLWLSVAKEWPMDVAADGKRMYQLKVLKSRNKMSGDPQPFQIHDGLITSPEHLDTP